MGTWTERSPQTVARTTGALWLACIATGMVSFLTQMFVVVVAGDPAATAANLAANQTAFRIGIVADLLSGACYLGVTALLYHLLKPAGKIISSVAALFGSGGIAISSVVYAAHFAPVVLLSSTHYLAAFTADQLQALSLATVTLQMGVYTMTLLFFGIQCVLAGVLIARSRFLPAMLGVLLAFGGSTYVAASVTAILAPAFAMPLLPVIMSIAVIGEGAVALWLAAKGVDVERWQQGGRHSDPADATSLLTAAI